MFALIKSFKMHYQVDGESPGTPLVFINSLGCELHIWEGMIQPFRDRFRIIRYDQRGHGLSDVPPGPYTLRNLTDDLSALLDHLEVDEVVLIGISVGGLVAMDFALLYPARVRRLVLCDTAPRIATPEMWKERIEAVHARGLEYMSEMIISRWFLPSFHQTHPKEYRQSLEMLSNGSPEGYIATCTALRDADLGSSLQAIVAPALVLCGAGDLVVTPEQTLEWASCLPKGRVEIIDGAAHLPCIEQPEAVASAIYRFLLEDGHE
ncbi:MAG: 3-oxoadipate enol-lactonase [Omnitrophica WOR_2 bacterium]